jgi:hypothetical protein
MTTPLWEKVGGQLAKRFEAEKIELLQEVRPDSSKHEDYCAVSIAAFQEITNLKQGEAGLLMRQIVSGALLPHSKP